jgi:hypothetical protein
MFRLRYVVLMLTNAVIVGSLIILVLSLGYVGWVPVFGAILIGHLLSYPAARLVARWIKTDDPAWNETMDRPVAAELRRREEESAAEADAAPDPAAPARRL